MNYNIDLGLVKKLPNLRWSMCVSFFFTPCTCSNYGLKHESDSKSVVFTFLIIQNTLIMLSTGMCIPADIITRCLVFYLGDREMCLWAQL